MNISWSNSRGYFFFKSLKKISKRFKSPFSILEQPSPEFLNFLVQACPLLTELDLSGLKNVTASVIQNIIEFKQLQRTSTKGKITNAFYFFDLIITYILT